MRDGVVELSRRRSLLSEAFSNFRRTEYFRLLAREQLFKKRVLTHFSLKKCNQDRALWVVGLLWVVMFK